MNTVAIDIIVAKWRANQNVIVWWSDRGSNMTVDFVDYFWVSVSAILFPPFPSSPVIRLSLCNRRIYFAAIYFNVSPANLGYVSWENASLRICNRDLVVVTIFPIPFCFLSLCVYYAPPSCDIIMLYSSAQSFFLSFSSCHLSFSLTRCSSRRLTPNFRLLLSRTRSTFYTLSFSRTYVYLLHNSYIFYVATKYYT